MLPSPDESICLLSYEVARIRLGGGPQERPSFWKVYREELELNIKTGYQNSHLEICRPFLLPLKEKLPTPHYYRNSRLVTEKKVTRCKPEGALPLGARRL